MAARGFAYVLQHVRLNHYNLFTTQEFVTQLTNLRSPAAALVQHDLVCDITLVQLDVKNMYSEIQHDCIQRCLQFVCDAWRRQGGCKSLAVTKIGRRGVAPGRTRSRADAVTMSVTAVVQILLFELQHAFFRVGSSVSLAADDGCQHGQQRGPCPCLGSVHGL